MAGCGDRGAWLAAAVLVALLGARPASGSGQVGWGKRIEGDPSLQEYDVGTEVDEARYNAYQAARLRELSAWLRDMGDRLREGKLSVGVYPAHRRELQAIASGFRALGAKVDLHDKAKLSKDWHLRNDVLVTYAFNPGRFQARLDAGKHTMVVELAYIRGKVMGTVQQSLTWDGVNNRGLHPVGPPERWHAMAKSVKAAPWTDGCRGSAVIFGQVSDDRTLIPITRRWGSPNAFLQWATDRIRAVSNLSVFFKAHPSEIAKKKGKYFRPQGAVDVSRHSMDSVLRKAQFAVVANSGAGVHALLAGVPVFAADPGFMGWRCALHDLSDLGNISLYDRSSCFSQIAHSQWSMKELGNGVALRHMMNPDNYRPELHAPRPPVERTLSCPAVPKLAPTAGDVSANTS